MCIVEGDVGGVGCPDPECVKKKGKEGGEDVFEAEEEEVRRVVGEERAVGRWKWLRRKRQVERGMCVVFRRLQSPTLPWASGLV